MEITNKSIYLRLVLGRSDITQLGTYYKRFTRKHKIKWQSKDSLYMPTIESVKLNCFLMNK